MVNPYGVPSCAVKGMGYNDPKMNNTLNGAYTTGPEVCQQTCRHTVFCMYFTWYNDTKACWLQGDASQLTVIHPDVYSGPADCSDTTTLPPTTTTSSENTTNATNFSLVVAPQQSAMDVQTMEADHHMAGNEVPWYGWAGILLALTALLLLLFWCCFGQKKKGIKRGAMVPAPKTTPYEEVPQPPVDMQPLMGTEMQLEAQMAPQYSYSMPPAPAPVPMTYSVAAPVSTYSVAAPAPVTSYSVAAPAPMTSYSVAAPAPMTSYSVAAPAPVTSYSVAAPAPVTYSVAAPVTTYSMAAPATTPAGVLVAAPASTYSIAPVSTYSVAEPSASVAQPVSLAYAAYVEPTVSPQ